MSTGLLVIGDVVTDVVAKPHTALAPDTDTAARIALRPGGSGANTAAWAAHAGARVTMLARVGNDTEQWHRQALAKNSVHAVLRVDAEYPTAIVMALISPAGERTMVTDRGAGAWLSVDDWQEDLLTDVKHVHVSGYTLFSQSGRALAEKVFATCAAKNISTSVDPASTSFLSDFGVDQFRRITANVAVIFPNLDEAKLLSGSNDADSAACILAQQYPVAAVTCGYEGALLAEAGKITARVPGTKMPVTDTVGAGDAFTGSFLAARLAGADLPTAAARGCAAGAKAITVVGGRPTT